MSELNNFEKNQIALSENFFEAIYEDMGAILVTRKLQKWYELNYNEFCIELSRFKVSPASVIHRNWESYFNEQKQEYKSLTNPINEKSEKKLSKELTLS